MMRCPGFGGDGLAGISDALTTIDCRTAQATGYAFTRLFGADGRLLPALTILLTLYVAIFALALLTGRTRLGLATLSPRMLTLGLVLTFATSWAAYQGTVWALLTGAPDQLAGLLTGSQGSATAHFARQLDTLFASVAEAAQAASTPAPPTSTGITPAPTGVGGVSASTAIWISAVLLLLGTVGVLVTAKVALAAMLALGPVFIVLALFRGTHGLFEGWLKAAVLMAMVPMFAVLLGSGTVAALDPVVAAIAAGGSQPEPRLIAILFLGAAVHCALMVMAVKAAGTIVAGWRLPGGRDVRAGSRDAGIGAAAVFAPPVAFGGGGGGASPAATAGDDRVRHLVATMTPSTAGAAPATPASSSIRVLPVVGGAPAALLPAPAVDRRLHGVGARYRARPAALPGAGLS